jgi:hypothetical protein
MNTIKVAIASNAKGQWVYNLSTGKFNSLGDVYPNQSTNEVSDLSSAQGTFDTEFSTDASLHLAIYDLDTCEFINN